MALFQISLKHMFKKLLFVLIIVTATQVYARLSSN